MSSVVIAYPKLSTEDFGWIQDIRKEHDQRMFEIIKPHVTFVFPTNKLDAVSLAKHVKERLNGFRSFRITLDSTKVVEDHTGEFTHTFLVPSTGFDQITQLHDLLYVDDLASELRLDIPFIPHLGIGSDSDKQAMEELAESLDKSGKSISGTIDKLVVCEYDGTKVTDVTTIPLA